MLASIIDSSEDDLTSKHNDDIRHSDFLFIDDGYDPTSRVRKGRIFQRQQSAIQDWYVTIHPAYPDEGRTTNSRGEIKKSLISFLSFNFLPKLNEMNITEPLIVLGSKLQSTVWSVLDVETSISGETILFLKARKTLGALPFINYYLIDDKFHDNIKDKLNILSEEIHRAGPESVVDCCREAIAAILSAYLQMQEKKVAGKDLAELAQVLNQLAEKKHVVRNLADTVAKLHNRRKNAVQEKLNPRRITNQDAELAIQSVGTIICDLGWGRW